MKKYNLAFITRNCGKIDPHSIDSYIEAGGYGTALNIFSRNCENIINEIKKSELRRRFSHRNQDRNCV
jgi:NADH:ubiquinone oxidoreductase subunit F (NADH-binding)